MKFLQEFVDFYKSISHFGHQLEVGDINHTFTNLQALEDIKIPLFNVEINIYHAFKLLSKFFAFNNEVDDYITISYDYDKRLIRESMLLNVGVGDSIIQDVITDAIPEDFTLEGDDSVVFQSVSKFIQGKYSTQIGRIKIVDAQFLEKLIQAIQSAVESQKDNGDTHDLFRDLLETFEQNHIRGYPEMPMLIGLKKIAEIFSNYSGNNPELLKGMESKRIPITFFDDDWYITFLQDTTKIQISKPYEFGRITNKDHFQWINFVKEFKTVYSKKYGAKVCYFVDINWCIDFLSDVCESKFPMTKERFEYLLQRFLYFVKQNEELWDVIPRPISYNEYIRLLTRLLSGFHINPRKLSYWSIPSNLTHFLKENFGPSDQIVLLMTENEKITSGLKLKMEKSTIGEIVYLDKNEIEISTSDEKEIYNQVVSQFGFTNSIIYINKSILHKLMKFLIIDRNSRNPIKYLSTLFLISKLNNHKVFNCYPELPWFTFFKKMGALRSFRLLNKLLYDFLEF